MRLTLDLDTELTATERLNNFCIYIAPQPAQFLILNGNQTLQQVNEKFWKVKFWFQIFCINLTTKQLTGFLSRFQNLKGQQADGNVLRMEEIVISNFFMSSSARAIDYHFNN